MSLSRYISERRPTVILVVLVALSLISMATGTRAAFIRNGIRTAVSVTAYPFLKVLTATERGAHYVSGLVFSYDASRKEADALRRQLGELQQHAAQRTELIQENRRLRGMIQFVRSQPQFTLEPVEVKAIENFKGILMVDRGSLHGIRPSTCAVTEDGIVGLVIQVDPVTSNVVTLYNPNCWIGAMIARNRVRGVVQGSSSDLSLYCSMNFIDMKDEVRVGDQVVASPESSIFPPGYPIGKVVAVHDTKSLWKSADVEPAVDPYRLDELFILQRAAASAEEMAGPPPGDETVAAGPAIPDKRTLQERYAP